MSIWTATRFASSWRSTLTVDFHHWSIISSLFTTCKAILRSSFQHHFCHLANECCSTRTPGMGRERSGRCIFCQLPTKTASKWCHVLATAGLLCCCPSLFFALAATRLESSTLQLWDCKTMPPSTVCIENPSSSADGFLFAWVLEFVAGALSIPGGVLHS